MGATSSAQRPGKDASRELELIGKSKAPYQAAATARRNGSFVFDMAWRMTASLRATAIFAFLGSEQELLKIDGMEGSPSAGAR
ncbi:hypothetical protein [Mesorhizobium helmanticense]|uniref:hypothetical protein n=1 Tax=Mesorhizobium helmanticense TaxID=1776423 RepID=UPI00142E5979|nr:hypothetical protein [Mesorhizobium helmanticense]